MESIVERLKGSSHRSTTRRSYLSVWRSFNEFYIKLDRKPSKWEDRLVLFVGHLINSKKKSTTIQCYVSAIKAVLTQDGVILNEDRCVINALTKSCRILNHRVKMRLPIQKKILKIIIKYTKVKFDQQPYLGVLYAAIFTIAYYGLFRVGELATGTHPVKAVDVHIGENKKKLMFILRTSKTHDQSMKPQIIKITSNDKVAADAACCPFAILQHYAQQRRSCRHRNEPFFIFRDRAPVTPVHVRKILREVLSLAGLNARLYDTHSFRTGRCVDLAAMNVSVESIRKFGRWSSSAVYKYLAGL